MGGRKVAEKLWINPRVYNKKRALPCNSEMMDLLTCFKRNSYEDTRCAGEIKALTQCMAAQSTKPKEVNTINYHLQRLSRGG